MDDTGSTRLRIIGLMGEWRRAMSAHAALGGGIGCACGSAFDGVSMQDLEHDLVAYVHEKHAAALQVVFELAECGPDQPCDLATLLRAIGDAPSQPDSAIDGIIGDLERAIRGLTTSTARA